MFSIILTIDRITIEFNELDPNRHLYGEILFGVIKDLINSDTQTEDSASSETSINSIFYPIDFFDETVIGTLPNDVIHESPNSIIFKSEDLDLHTIADEVGLLVLPSLKCNCPSCPKAENLFEFCNLSSREQTIKSVATFETLNQVCNSDEFLNSIKSVFYRSTSIEVLEEIKEIDEIGLTPIKVIKVTPNFNKPPYKVLTSSQVFIDELIRKIGTLNSANDDETEDTTND